ncbi:hypothetical protein [Ponticaulis profundi]|uniref:DUF2383 domain-containing protein n=1 Tax=Ponticaulis profundi TaxID=2665222 RepID=A0ABW1S7Z5_9PROT
MTIATNKTLASLFAEAKSHEHSLGRAVNTAHPVEREVFGELLTETRDMVYHLEHALELRNMHPEQIDFKRRTDTITPHKLIAEREAIRDTLGQALSEYTTKSSVREVLKTQYSRLSGDGQDKLEILCAAILSDQ